VKAIEPAQMGIVGKTTDVKIRRFLMGVLAIVCVPSADPRDNCVQDAFITYTSGAEAFAVY
jgi:hypothetical protein